MKDENKLIVANWKMNPQSTKEAETLLKNVSNSIKNLKKATVIICPPYPFLYLKDKLKIKNKMFKLGSQDVFYENKGAYTGEISTDMIKDFKVEYVIVGHSEARTLGDTNLIINKKISSILKSKITPIFCIGENKRDTNGFYLSFIKEQIEDGLSGITKNQIKNLVIAYEPVWSIGKDAERVVTIPEFIEIRIYIKKILSILYDINTANQVKILYGGSVNINNAESFIIDGGADGVLIGRDSLNPKKFTNIINLISKPR